MPRRDRAAGVADCRRRPHRHLAAHGSHHVCGLHRAASACVRACVLCARCMCGRRPSHLLTRLRVNVAAAGGLHRSESAEARRYCNNLGERLPPPANSAACVASSACFCLPRPAPLLLPMRYMPACGLLLW
eukprot:2524859-Pleurochrysis_carterae.AAC.2